MRHPRRLFARLLLALALATGLARPAGAVSLIRDADIEHALAQLARPVLTAAGLNPARVKVIVIQDANLNAFVTDPDHIFIHSGLILRLKRPEALQSVIAHEAAHIANGHLIRRALNARTANTVTGLGLGLALAAAASTGKADAAGGIALGVAGSAKRVFNSHTQSEESAADQSGLRYMARSGIDPAAALDILEIFRGQEALTVARQDPYVQTHPLSRDRYRAVQALAVAYADSARPDPEAAYWFARMQGKLSAFLRAPKWTMTRAPEGPTADITLMRQAVAYHRQSDLKRALAAMDRLIALRPQDPYVHELKGQILLESRQWPAAVAAYRRASDLAPNNALILGGYGRALLAAGNAKSAITVLEKSRARDFADARVMRDLGAAYAKTGQPGMTSLVTAERYALMGRMADAELHATRAAGQLPRGSSAWQRAQDVIFAAQDMKRKRR